MIKVKLWKSRVQKVYDSLDELRSYDSVYGIAERCGYRSVNKFWDENPMIQGSTNPADFGLARQPKKRIAK